ncbi:iron-containing alcohol dehydrogenase [Halorientalis sp.]|jgi:alcohol dehydrogenase class IV|uniref:iron-containing alcohol dehydrogenase n=1 Tax=Halorientalis sp. TaxID=1931229 RepID=UPI00260E51D2|nr:iron-containing alcohol dehydrogenase [Halorientalis sp.]
MDDYAGGFRFAHDYGPIRYGRGCVTDLSDELAGTGAERALVVCGGTVGATAEVIGPVETGGTSDAALADAVVARVVEIRDALGLPSSLRAVDGIAQSDLPGIAADTLDDSLLDYAPTALNPTAEELEDVLHEAW